MFSDLPSESQNLSVLIIEDDDADAEILEIYLKSQGLPAQYSRVASKRALLDVIQSMSWDIVLSDYSLPGFSGDEALKIVRQHCPDVPFVFVSGQIGEEVAVEAMRVGAQDYVMKDNLRRLAAVIRRELRDVAARAAKRQAELKLKRIYDVVDQAFDSVCISDEQGNIEYVNLAFEKITGYSSAEVLGTKLNMFNGGVELEGVDRHGDAPSIIENVRKNGEAYQEERSLLPLFENGAVSHYAVIGRDVTEKYNIDQMRARFNKVLDITTDFVAITDSAGDLIYINHAARDLLGLYHDKSEMSLYDFYSNEVAQYLFFDVIPFVEEAGAWQGECAMSRYDGQEIITSHVVIKHVDERNGSACYSIIARDITDRIRLERKLKHQVSHDSLTGLANRNFFMVRLKEEIARAERCNKHLAVMFVDLDNFKRINDSWGHSAGDKLLVEVATRMKQCFRSNDVVARYAGDEFCILAADLETPDMARAIATKLSQLFKSPIHIDDRDVMVSYSMGVAVYPNDGRSDDSLIRNADMAMYHAKEKGKSGTQFFSQAMRVQGSQSLSTALDLRSALSRNEFVIHYQPQYNLRTGQVNSYEALLRWDHPHKGLILPLEFLDTLEESDMIDSVGEWVVRSACQQMRTQAEGGVRARVAVNISPKQLCSDNFVDTVRRVIKDEAVDPNKLELELTEYALMNDVNTSIELLGELDRLGVRLAIDDFGTGYSSLAYLKKFPVDALKIDQTFIRDFRNENDAAIIEASIGLGHKLGLDVVAEGVETRAQMNFLNELNCNYVQGYFIGRPSLLADIKATDFISFTPVHSS